MEEMSKEVKKDLWILEFMQIFIERTHYDFETARQVAFATYEQYIDEDELDNPLAAVEEELHCMIG